MEERITTYEERKQHYTNKLKETQNQERINSAIRLTVFFSVLAAIAFFYQEGFGAVMAILLLGALGFVFLVRRGTKLNKEAAYYEAMAQINENEMNAVYGGYLEFEEGNSYLTGDHPYSSDLDIFGRGSIFQYINRTCTLLGRDLLAGWLSEPELNPEVILSRQEAVKELTPLLEWRQEYQSAGNAKDDSKDDKAKVMEWLAEPIFFANKWYLRAWLYISPAIMALLIVAGVFNLIDVSFVVAWFFLQLGTALAFNKRISQFHNKVSSRHQMLSKYSKLLGLIETQEFQSPMLAGLKQKVHIENESAAESFGKLTRIVDSFESRQNILGAIFTNGLFLWDLHNAVRLEQWKEKFKHSLEHWFNTPAQIDALNSLATLAYNRPTFNYPVPESGPFHLEAKDLGHPMLYEASRIDNDITFGTPGTFIMTTGANMAGKSTFLRAMGVNLLLGTTGAPVCAGEFRFVPTQIYTSMRASDSLLEHESFFYAELMKLKSIIDALQEGKHMFILLDEILKGTNSKDQQTGSRAFVKQLVGLKASGMIATHDLALGDLAETHPGLVHNMCFEIAIEDEEMVFDYKLKNGISQSLNATFLMKKMGITV